MESRPFEAFAKRQVWESSAAARSKNRNGKRRPLPAFDDGHTPIDSS